jgi:para-aminobenzoate synthetase component 1
MGRETAGDGRLFGLSRAGDGQAEAVAVILLEFGPGGQPVLFAAPRGVIAAWQPAAVAPALQRAERLRRAGAWIAGYVAYEAGYAMEPKLRPLMPRRRSGPLLVLGVFDGPQSAGARLDQARDEGRVTAISPPEPLIGRRAYGNAARKVFDYIAAGDCYQVNLTFPRSARLMRGTPLGLYGAFRRTGAVGHGAFVDLGVGPVVVSRSPELFFKVDGGRIVTRPMKGTRPRGKDANEDAAIIAGLRADEKDRAENLMIVDLLRNDISRLSRLGTVKVPALYAIESYATVHQMTSTVEGVLDGPATLPGLMAALFPCGSVTGAPKIRAMQIIREVEPAPRGVYCGAIGWMSPDGQADFSVAIRTLAVTGDRIVMNVGGGLTHGSTVTGEWEEALWKARFVKAAVKPA